MLEHLEAECASFAHNHIVGRFVDDGIPVLVQRGEQPALTNDVGRASWLLPGQKPGGSHRASENVSFLHRHSHTFELCGHIASGSLTVICQEQKWNIPPPQQADKFHRARYKLRAAINHSVHVDQESFFHF